MKHDREDNRIVYQSLAMIMQFGLNMIVPVCMMSALGIWLDRRFGTSFWTILLFAAGAVAGGQNIYRLARKVCEDPEAQKSEIKSSEIKSPEAEEPEIKRPGAEEPEIKSPEAEEPDTKASGADGGGKEKGQNGRI